MLYRGFTRTCNYNMLFQELSVFISMVKDVFGGTDLSSMVGLREPIVQDVLSTSIPMAPTASTKMLSSPKLAFVSELLQQQATKIHLVPSACWMTKVEQLFILSQLKHGNERHCSATCTCRFLSQTQ